MSRLEVISATTDKSEKNMVMNGEFISRQDYLNISIEHILLTHHKKRGKITSFHLSETDPNEDILFIVSQDPDLNKELKMLEPKSVNHPNKSMDLFEESKTDDYDKVKISHLLEKVENNKVDYQLGVDGLHYSFRVVTGIQANKTIDLILDYIDDASVHYGNDSNKKVKM